MSMFWSAFIPEGVIENTGLVMKLCHLNWLPPTLHSTESWMDSTWALAPNPNCLQLHLKHILLDSQVMGQGYLQQRGELVDMALGLGRRLQLKDETIHDAVLLMDRVMSTGVRVSSACTHL